jgi:hypothetical protein
MKDYALTLAISRDGGQIVAWVLLLFALTILGALPLLVQGLNLSKVSSSTPHSSVVVRSHTGCTACRGILSWSWRNSFSQSSGKGMARPLHLVCDRPHWANRCFPFSRGVQCCLAGHALDDSAIILWTRRFVLRYLRIAFCRRTGAGGLCSAAVADPLRCSGSQHPESAKSSGVAVQKRSDGPGFEVSSSVPSGERLRQMASS